MSGMNPWLAEIYGTDGGDDLEKTAQMHLLNKLAADGNVDLSQFSPEELQALLTEVMGDEAQGQNGGQPLPGQQMPGQDMGQQMGQQQAPQSPMMGNGLPGQPSAFAPAAQQQQGQQQPPQGMQPFQMAAQQQGGGDAASMQKEAAAKFDEADLLGRVMAHAYTQELEKIAADKTAGRFGAAKESVKGAVGGAKNRASHFAERASAKAHSKATEYGMKARAHKGAIGAAAATGAAGFAAGRMSKSKEAAAGPYFMKLAEMNAADILSSAGYDPSTGQDTTAAQQTPDAQQDYGQTQQQQAGGVAQPGQPQTSDPGAEFTQALDQTSLDMLSNAGYDVNEILARLQFANQQDPGQA